MISRTVLTVDRIATLVLSLALLAGGGAAAWWWSGRSGLPQDLDTGPVSDVGSAGWWPAAAVLAALVLGLVGLWWLRVHVRRTSVGRLPVQGSDRDGRLDVDGGKVATAAASAFEQTMGVRSARGRLVRDRGQLVVRLSASIDRDADLRLLAGEADRVATELAAVLDRPDLRCSVELRVALDVAGALTR